MSKSRRNFNPEEKVAILKKHLVEKESVSDLCDKYNLQPTVFYRWQKQFFENGSSAFHRQSKRKTTRIEQKVTALEQKLIQKNEVLAELMEEHISLKKSLGEI
jgi:transposase-like protein|tara:strand:+ start:75 stop:383 length:309 start_codon:yes stop_codon:yes gene_type:complete